MRGIRISFEAAMLIKPDREIYFEDKLVRIFKADPCATRQYNGLNDYESSRYVRSFIEAVTLLNKGYRLVEIHAVERSEADYQFIFSTRRQDRSNPVCGWEKYQTGKILQHLLINAYGHSAVFKFSDCWLASEIPGLS